MGRINKSQNKSILQTDIGNPVYQHQEKITSNVDSTYSIVGDNKNTYSEIRIPMQKSTASTNCLINNDSPDSYTGLNSIPENGRPFGNNSQAESMTDYEGTGDVVSDLSTLPLNIEPIATVNNYEMPQDSYSAFENVLAASELDNYTALNSATRTSTSNEIIGNLSETYHQEKYSSLFESGPSDNIQPIYQVLEKCSSDNMPENDQPTYQILEKDHSEQSLLNVGDTLGNDQPTYQVLEKVPSNKDCIVNPIYESDNSAYYHTLERSTNT